MRQRIHNAFVSAFWTAFWIVILLGLWLWLIVLPIAGLVSFWRGV